MFAPILPSPIMPSCIVSLLSGAVWGGEEKFWAAPLVRVRGEHCCCAIRGRLMLLQRLLYCRIKSLQILRNVFAEVDAKRTAASFVQHGEVPASLRRLYDAERVFLSRHFDVDRI